MCNMLACLFGTIVGNPWTLPIFFYLDYALGTFLLQLFGSPTSLADTNLAEFISLFMAEPVALTGEVFKQLVSAVLYCHKQGVAHRNLKPSNTLLVDAHKVKIAEQSCR